MNEQEKYDIRKEADAIMDREAPPTVEEIRKMMKKSGKSFAQIVKESKKVRKDMAAAREAVESRGEYFSEKDYLKERMGTKPKVIVKRK